MTRFIYIADTHLGANPIGYHQQVSYADRLPDILEAMEDFIAETGGIDFILHGGDMIDAGTEQNIRDAADAFRLSVPVYLCLGNHDLTEPDSFENWMALAPRLFPGAQPEFTIEAGNWRIHVVPNHWCEIPYRWIRVQDVGFFPDQYQWLETECARAPGAPRIFVTHAPPCGLPCEQTGLSEPFHSPPESFSEAIDRIATRYPAIQCVLGAHNHMNLHVERAESHYVTAPALTESPFEFKLIEATPDGLSMQTFSLADRLEFEPEYNEEKRFVQGRPVDRTLDLTLTTTRG